jgi:hypothetical protein
MNRFLVVGMVAVLGAACGGGSGSDVSPEPAVLGDSIMVEVENQDFYDASIQYSYRGTERRLGNVTGKSQGSFTIPWEPVPIRFTINFIGAGRTVSDEIPVERGDILVLRLPPDAHRSRRLTIP